MYKIEGGLITGPEEGKCAGYIFNFQGHGSYDPTGKIKVGELELTQEQVDAHNKILAEAEMKAVIAQGRGLFYLSYDTPKCSPDNPRWKQENAGTWRESNYRVSNWTGTFNVKAYVQKSFTPGFNCSTRIYFTGPDGKQWYGIHQGEFGQVCRARRLKKQNQ